MAATAATSLLGSVLLLPPACTSTRRKSGSERTPGAKMWIANANFPSWAVSGVPQTRGTVSPRAAASSAESSGRIGALNVASLPVKELMEALDAAGRRGAEMTVTSSSQKPPLSSSLKIHSHGTDDAFQNLMVDSKWQREAVKVALVAGLLCLQGCLPALAENLGLEVARSDQPIGFMSDLGDFQSGFTSVGRSDTLAIGTLQGLNAIFGHSSFGGFLRLPLEAFLLIFFSEIGDKTFFIAALLATRKSNIAVFTGTFGALAAMTVISVTLGRAFHYLDNILPFSLGDTQLPLDDLAAVVLLVYFGVSTLIDAASMEGSKAEEEQQEAELAIAGVGSDAAVSTVAATFTLVFVAEWGDKSFFSTIALAAASSPLGVVSGAIAGHGAATVLAVLGGAFLGNYVSEKVIAYVGGVLFLVFAGATLVEIVK